jgi:DNA polymerase (family 10)
MENVEIARIFSEMADLAEIVGGDDFRTRSWRRVVRALEGLPERAETMLADGRLIEVPGIGKGTVKRIAEIVESGDCEDHRELVSRLPMGLLDVIRIPGVGPKSAKLFYEKLDVTDVDLLEQAAMSRMIRGLDGMGAKKEENILKGIRQFRLSQGRFKLTKAYPYAEEIADALSGLPEVQKIDLAGSVRRRKETVGDLDILAASTQPDPVMEAFASLPSVDEVLLSGETKTSLRLKSGIQVDLRVLPPESYGAALHYFTGSKEHNVAIRDRGKRQGLKISEYGVFREEDDHRLGGATEEEVFHAVGLPFIPPELREHRGEIEAAETGQLPDLLREVDLRGDLHCHTSETDGAHTIRQMAEAAKARGYEYIAITDHSKAVTVARGMDEARLVRHMEAIDRVNRDLDGIAVLKGIEVDILADGSLDLADEVLRELDVVIGSVHSYMGMPRSEMTARIVAALETGLLSILGHPTGRLLTERPAYEVDMEAVMETAARVGVCMELNAFPDRLDLSDVHCRLARDMGVPVAISTDAHNTRHLPLIRFGVYTARRGWLEPRHVLNTLPLDQLLARLDRKGESARR